MIIKAPNSAVKSSRRPRDKRYHKNSMRAEEVWLPLLACILVIFYYTVMKKYGYETNSILLACKVVVRTD